jgi:hypothetical protein
MPLHYMIDTAQRLITITGEYADDGEWRVLLGQLLEDSRQRPGLPSQGLRSASTLVDAATAIGIIDVVHFVTKTSVAFVLDAPAVVGRC